MEKRWLGMKRCDFCSTTEAEFFVDSKTQRGPWAFMCPDCWTVHGVTKLGLGYGQKYHGETLEKIEG